MKIWEIWEERFRLGGGGGWMQGNARVKSLEMAFIVFFFYWTGSVLFGFFGLKLTKPKPNRTGQFLKNSNRFNRFFFTVWFFRLFFFQFSRFNRFFGFFAHPYTDAFKSVGKLSAGQFYRQNYRWTAWISKGCALNAPLTASSCRRNYRRTTKNMEGH